MSRCGNNFCATEWQFYTDILQGVDIPAGKTIREKENFRKIFQEEFLSRFGKKRPYAIPNNKFVNSENWNSTNSTKYSNNWMKERKKLSGI